MELYSPKELASLYNVSTETLRLWAKDGKIKCSRTSGGHHRYTAPQTSQNIDPLVNIIYARVSSVKQKNDLERQVHYLRERYPHHTIIKDIGSGINFKRKGLKTILDLLLKGSLGEVVVAHRDRLVRFGFELFEYLFKLKGCVLTVLDNEEDKEPATQLSEDLLAIITVFSSKYYGSRKYNTKSKKGKDLPKQGTSQIV